MPAKNILLLDRENSDWEGLLSEFFEDTPSKLHVFSDSATASAFFNHPPDVSFLNFGFVSPAFLQRMKVFRQSHHDIRVFGIGGPKPSSGFPVDDFFDFIF